MLTALPDYRHAVALDEPFRPLSAPAPAGELELLTSLALRMLGDDPWVGRFRLPREAGDRRRMLRAVLTVREPAPLDPELVAVLDALLGGERQQRPLTNALTLPAPIAVWRGDITRLRADAIVNAANDALLGCFQPLHACVDNAIHDVAGPRLRADCRRIMTLQGTPEPTGTAKITRGYHLPAPFVLHTVGPIVRGNLLPAHGTALADSYRACLDLAAEVPGIRTIAFSGISTGIFGFPKRPAARTAIGTVRDWLATRPGRFDRVVFVAFSGEDETVYRELS
ncbi:protein-ADP-ribose hydrolase [Lentzea sp. BCCO 10_0061]|uniref:Protein-ADP-ribose hydrolase n=1 Tax=Lentzea sokolovensis TaxID=3095429 RepID=A0ABU4V7C6_9PSEU|nr:protein-ADP-ribose hydrolase [Lentzea sp. BCCO 10_0061]MDX8147696.1 protein-ADP-ribose hydrolase [Lentzea sp. BCCO 10_0061]